MFMFVYVYDEWVWYKYDVQVLTAAVNPLTTDVKRQILGSNDLNPLSLSSITASFNATVSFCTIVSTRDEPQPNILQATFINQDFSNLIQQAVKFASCQMTCMVDFAV